ncbi:MAG: hypothetical protein ACRYG5_12920 [Janthinobacterium lividum]
MQVVTGELNGVRLINLMHDAVGKCSRVTAAVAYATSNTPFFAHCREHDLFLDFYGLLDEDAAVSVPVLQEMLRAGPLVVSPRLIKGHFHSKIIWWHGYGAYIGSANLTSNAWFTNVECGMFFDEAEIIGRSLQADLEQQFDYLRSVSAPVTEELVKALDKLSALQSAVNVARKRLTSQFEQATTAFPGHAGLATYGSSIQTTAFTLFTTEWNQTLQLIRGLSAEFGKLNKRPTWVEPSANPTVHFDQFLHAYYYVRIRDQRDDEESVKSVELVNRAHERNKFDKTRALKEAVDWWASLPAAPYGEADFINSVSPMMKSRFALPDLRTWELADFQKVFSHVHAFKTHARQIKNATLGLPPGHSETVDERSDRVAQWMWRQPREASQKHLRDLLEFLIWGSTPTSMVERLWMVTNDERWRYDHFGPSTLGEAVGWARPDFFPPRNNRTNKALRALGHDVRLFSS